MTQTQLRLDTLCHDRRSYSPYCVGSRDDIERARAALTAVGDCTGYRIYRADRERPTKLPHSIRVPRETGWHGITIAEQAKIMAARIKASGQTVLPLFPDSSPSAREFNRELLNALSERRQVAGGYRVGLPDCYRVTYVDPADYTPKSIAAEIASELAPCSEAA